MKKLLLLLLLTTACSRQPEQVQESVKPGQLWRFNGSAKIYYFTIVSVDSTTVEYIIDTNVEYPMKEDKKTFLATSERVK